MLRSRITYRSLKTLLPNLMLVASIGLTAPPAQAEELFAEVEGNPLGTATDWTNYLVLADLNGDGDIDLIVPNCNGFFEAPVGAQPLRIYDNDGSAGFTESTTTALGGAVTDTIRVVAVGDVDNDGDLDFYAPSASGAADRFYINNGQGQFSDEAATRLPGVKSHSAAVKFGDVDNDGDLDLLVGGGYVVPATPPVFMYLNDGTGVFSDATDNLPQTMIGAEPDDLDWIDIDRDFDLDLLVNAHSGKSALWRNNGDGTFSDITAQLADMDSGYHYNPSTCDVDGDGDLDIWTDNIGGNYAEQLQINDGAGTFSDKTNAQVSGNVAGADDNGTLCIDVDSDGDFDVLIPTLATARERVLFNDGSGNFSLGAGDDHFSNTNGDPTLWMDFADLNGDGRLDVVTGQGEGNPQRNRLFLGTSAQVVDTRPPKIIKQETLPATVGAGAIPVLRFAVSDRVVSDVGPRLKRAFVKVSVDGSNSEITATFMGGDLFRAQLPAQATQGATVSVEACATDRQDNTACGAAQSYTIMGSSSSSGAGSGGSSGSSGSSGGSGQGAFEPVDDSGCNCTLTGRKKQSASFWWLTLVGLALFRRRWNNPPPLKP